MADNLTVGNVVPISTYVPSSSPRPPQLTPTAAPPTQKAPVKLPMPVGGPAGQAGKQGLATQVNAAVGATLGPPKSLVLGNTKQLGRSAATHFHAVIYSETSARKTTTAAKFGTPKNTRIIITRRKEQLIPLQNLGYEYAVVEDYNALMYALQYPERLWPDWAQLEDRTLIVDDLTEGIELLLEEYEDEIDGKPVNDARRTYKEAGNDLRDSLLSLLRKPMNLVIVCLARVNHNPITNEERVAPDLPPSMANKVLAEMEFVFYINPETYRFTCEKDFFAFQAPDPERPTKQKTFKRAIFAKYKVSEELAKQAPPIIAKYEAMDLRGIWERVKAGEAKVTR